MNYTERAHVVHITRFYGNRTNFLLDFLPTLIERFQNRRTARNFQIDRLFYMAFRDTCGVFVFDKIIVRYVPYTIRDSFLSTYNSVRTASAHNVFYILLSSGNFRGNRVDWVTVH